MARSPSLRCSARDDGQVDAVHPASGGDLMPGELPPGLRSPTSRSRRVEESLMGRFTLDTPRMLGAAFLAVILTSLFSGVVMDSALGSGSTADVLRNAVADEGTVRVAVIMAMLNAAGIVVLATLLWAVLGRFGRVAAVVGVGLWLGEAFFYVVGYVGANGLIGLGHDFVAAGSPAGWSNLSLGDFLYNGVYKLSGSMLMFFYCAGGFLFYSLFYVSRVIPRVLAAFGLAVVALAMVAVVLELLGYGNLMALMAPVGIFELITGLWLLLGRANANVLASANATAGVAT